MLDPQENGLKDIPDYDGIEDEAFPPLPPPHSPGRGGQEEEDPFAEGDEGEVSRLADVPAAKRRGVKRPQPKLDSQRLISEKGLPALKTLFDKIHFKGKGHEAADLRMLMQKMENWAHRLYPKLQFEDFIDKVEKLGSKKEVQTCLKRIRLDMPLTHEDFTGADGTGEEEAAAEVQIFGDPDPFSVNELQGQIQSTPAFAPPPTPSLTEEQRRRMELNRQRALEKRLARQQQQISSSGPQTVDALGATPPAAPSPNVINSSSDGDEKVENSDLEPASSNAATTIIIMQQSSQLPPKDSEGEQESSPSPEHQPSNDSTEGD
ncbi:TIMELESS-interacting protein isoform X2 [Archocentrus centrarchus]|nr:TIMELESS-interacting protein isoform X2 [Archocentrus centrarchus]